MKKILTLFAVILLAGCAAQIETLMADAKECVANSINERGIIGQPSEERRALCWAEVNKRMEADARREKNRRSEGQCTNGFVAWCDRRFGDNRCSCVSQQRVRDALSRAGMAW